MMPFDDDLAHSPQPPHELPGEPESQQWACGPFGWWPELGAAPVGVSWGLLVPDWTSLRPPRISSTSSPRRRTSGS